MRTLDLHDAAEFLRMSPEGLRRLAKSGKIPARKPGKQWVFVDQHLAEWLRGNYDQKGQVTQGSQEETDAWGSIKGEAPGGLISSHQTEKEYAELLAQRTKGKPKSTTTKSRQKHGGPKSSENVQPIHGKTP